jgi:hypothetical protein
MATTVGRFRPPALQVSITNGSEQIEFDSPADMHDYLTRHPEVVRDLHNYDWTTQPLRGGH